MGSLLDASLGVSLAKARITEWAIKADKNPKFGRLAFRMNVIYAYICQFSISHRRLEKCLDFLNIKALHDIPFRVRAVTRRSTEGA